ncbi:type 1 fimbrial protein, partial [Escherichia coli]|nr:type 1 fimbrial protein [Escherichia coli]
VSVQNNNATFNLKARAVSKGQVTPGDISSVITVTYTYS